MPTHYEGSAREVRALDAFIKLVRAAGSVVARTNRSLAARGLTPGQFGVLESLLHLGPLNQCDVARKQLQTGGNITMIVDNLVRAGLVRRQRDTADRRCVRVHLTPAGRQRIARLFPEQAGVICRQLDVLSPAEQKELGRLCRKLGLGSSAAPPVAKADFHQSLRLAELTELRKLAERRNELLDGSGMVGSTAKPQN